MVGLVASSPGRASAECRPPSLPISGCRPRRDHLGTAQEQGANSGSIGTTANPVLPIRLEPAIASGCLGQTTLICVLVFGLGDCGLTVTYLRKEHKRTLVIGCGIAAHLGVNPDTIYKWIERKQLPAHKVGRLWKFTASEVDEWVRAGKVVDTLP